MVNRPPRPSAPLPQEHPEDAPLGWIETQQSLASGTGLSVLLVDGHQPPAVAISNNNSICQALQSSAKYVKLCDPYCGDAHRLATTNGTTVQYKCHAGLQCFAEPVEINEKKNLAVIGGRAFVASADYQAFVERLRSGDLAELASEEVFENIIFSEPQRIEELAQRVRKAVAHFKPTTTNGKPSSTSITQTTNEDLTLEVERLRKELEYRLRFADSLQHFLERISSDNPVETYNSIVSNSKALLQSERASLLVFDEPSNELILKAAIGMVPDPGSPIHVRLGEGVSGEVIETGKALMVADIARAGLAPATPPRSYKTNSFISYPITIGGRKIGVLNVTDKLDGGSFDEVDLSLLDIIGPQLALALERAGWQERAAEFQLMSITDPLTTLPNRRYLEERLTEELNRSKRYDYPMSFLMIDIDDFKSYNDNNGHQAGDLALQIAAHCLKSALRSADIASRYGGEEFCILLPQTNLAEAGAIADRIRQRVATTHFPHGKSQPLGRVSVSIGVSTFSKIVNSAETVIAAADRALYRAKHLGKDRIEFYYDEGVEPIVMDQ
jgi:diguanylate cyclase (GGDEF)-like protein